MVPPSRDRSRSRRNNRGISSYEQPLLGMGVEEDRFVDDVVNNNVAASRVRRHQHRPLRTLGPQHALPKPKSYQPPGGPGSVNYPKMLGLVASDLFHSGPQPPSVSRSIRRQTPARTTGIHHDLRKLLRKGPAEDLAGPFSYGCCCMQCVRTQEIGITRKLWKI